MKDRSFRDFLENTYKKHFGQDVSPSSFEMICGGGSTRLFFRLGNFQGLSLIGMRSENPPVGKNGIDENQSFVYIQKHLKAKGVNIPSIFAVDLERGWFALEDVGDTLLYDFIKVRGESSETVEFLKSAVHDLVYMQIECTKGFDINCVHNAIYDSCFAREYESSYFQEWFLRRYAGLDFSSIDSELDTMAEQLHEYSDNYFLYRDFQSQNIAIFKGKILFYLDFQGARLGPAQYDLASLIYDPYISLSEQVRRILINEYFKRVCEIDPNFDSNKFLKGLPIVAAHRLMQALGAYGFLSLQRKKVYFARYIPSALKNLLSVLENSNLSERYIKFGYLVNKLVKIFGN